MSQPPTKPKLLVLKPDTVVLEPALKSSESDDDTNDDNESDNDITDKISESVKQSLQQDSDEENETGDESDGEDEDDESSVASLEEKEVNPVAPQLRLVSNDFDEDDEEEDEDDEFYLQKLDESIHKKIISDFHPELQAHNYDEIDVLSRVVRDENGNIIDPMHKTVPFITRYEKARVLGERAKQINSGAKPFIELEPSVIDGYVIALREFEAKKIPFIVKRPMPNGGVEYWKLEDLEVLI